MTEKQAISQPSESAAVLNYANDEELPSLWASSGHCSRKVFLPSLTFYEGMD